MERRRCELGNERSEPRPPRLDSDRLLASRRACLMTSEPVTMPPVLMLLVTLLVAETCGKKGLMPALVSPSRLGSMVGWRRDDNEDNDDDDDDGRRESIFLCCCCSENGNVGSGANNSSASILLGNLGLRRTAEERALDFGDGDLEHDVELDIAADGAGENGAGDNDGDGDDARLLVLE